MHGHYSIFVDKEGNPKTPELMWWIPRQLHFSDKAVGGPYQEKIPIEDFYLDTGLDALDPPWVKITDLTVEYFVASIKRPPDIIHAAQIVDLGGPKSFETGGTNT